MSSSGPNDADGFVGRTSLELPGMRVDQLGGGSAAVIRQVTRAVQAEPALVVADLDLPGGDPASAVKRDGSTGDDS